MVTTVRPNATETPSNPIPTFGKAAARTALPQPPSTSQNVPMNSAESFENTAHSFGENVRAFLTLRAHAVVEEARFRTGVNEGPGRSRRTAPAVNQAPTCVRL